MVVLPRTAHPTWPVGACLEMEHALLAEPSHIQDLQTVILELTHGLKGRAMQKAHQPHEKIPEVRHFSLGKLRNPECVVCIKCARACFSSSSVQKARRLLKALIHSPLVWWKSVTSKKNNQNRNRLGELLMLR